MLANPPRMFPLAICRSPRSSWRSPLASCRRPCSQARWVPRTGMYVRTSCCSLNEETYMRRCTHLLWQLRHSPMAWPGTWRWGSTLAWIVRSERLWSLPEANDGKEGSLNEMHVDISWRKSVWNEWWCSECVDGWTFLLTRGTRHLYTPPGSIYSFQPRQYQL